MDNLSTFLSNPLQSWYILLGISFLGGFFASVSPCSLTMLPLIIGYIGGYSEETPIKTFAQLSFFILGTAIVFTILGGLCAISGNVFSSAFGQYFTLFIASVLLILGLKIFDVLDFEVPTIIKSMPVNNHRSIFVYPTILGITFALAGTPCSTPILAGIMAFATIGKNIALAILMLFMFSIGQGLILLVAGLCTSTLKNLKSVAKYTDILVKFSGMLLIIVACLFYWKVFSPLIG
ncbi:MAG: cytochrome c biogenesis CcdA family protein [bacterium]|nr:cytochrome c biogenesis CcdA family protein [bacterium]